MKERKGNFNESLARMSRRTISANANCCNSSHGESTPMSAMHVFTFGD